MSRWIAAACLVVSVEGVLANDAAVVPILAPDAASIDLAIEQWIDSQPEALRAEAGRQWTEASATSRPDERLNAVLHVAFLLSESVRELVDAATSDEWAVIEASLPELDLPPVAESNLRLFIGKTLITLGAMNEAEQVLNEAVESSCVDPAALSFLKAVCLHARLDKEHGLPVLERLLDPASVVPERYRSLARLMKQDLEDIEDNDLAQTARQMRDLQRQLQRGKSGKKTQEQERQILEKLDKMIEKMEQQQQQAQGQGGVPSGNNPDKPADDSRIAGQSGPGEVDRKPIGKSSGWGELPEKARTEARNLINRQFPSHYRQAVEEYLKKLADRPAK